MTGTLLQIKEWSFGRNIITSPLLKRFLISPKEVPMVGTLKKKVKQILKENDSLIDACCEEVESNIEDPTTYATNVRKINITIFVKPVSEKDSGEIWMETKTGLARRNVEPQAVAFGTDKNPTLELAK
jgi:hypothetical protein